MMYASNILKYLLFAFSMCVLMFSWLRSSIPSVFLFSLFYHNYVTYLNPEFLSNIFGDDSDNLFGGFWFFSLFF